MEAEKDILYKKYLEAKIYMDERDNPDCTSSNWLRQHYPEYLYILDITNIYRKIANYRIRVYGNSFLKNGLPEYSTTEEKNNYKHTKSQQQKRWRKKYGIYD